MRPQPGDTPPFGSEPCGEAHGVVAELGGDALQNGPGHRLARHTSERASVSYSNRDVGAATGRKGPPSLGPQTKARRAASLPWVGRRGSQSSLCYKPPTGAPHDKGDEAEAGDDDMDGEELVWPMLSRRQSSSCLTMYYNPLHEHRSPEGRLAQMQVKLQHTHGTPPPQQQLPDQPSKDALKEVQSPVQWQQQEDGDGAPATRSQVPWASEPGAAAADAAAAATASPTAVLVMDAPALSTQDLRTSGQELGTGDDKGDDAGDTYGSGTGAATGLGRVSVGDSGAAGSGGNTAVLGPAMGSDLVPGSRAQLQPQGAPHVLPGQCLPSTLQPTLQDDSHSGDQGSAGGSGGGAGPMAAMAAALCAIVAASLSLGSPPFPLPLPSLVQVQPRPQPSEVPPATPASPPLGHWLSALQSATYLCTVFVVLAACGVRLYGIFVQGGCFRPRRRSGIVGTDTTSAVSEERSHGHVPRTGDPDGQEWALPQPQLPSPSREVQQSQQSQQPQHLQAQQQQLDVQMRPVNQLEHPEGDDHWDAALQSPFIARETMGCRVSTFDVAVGGGGSAGVSDMGVSGPMPHGKPPYKAWTFGGCESSADSVGGNLRRALDMHGASNCNAPSLYSWTFSRLFSSGRMSGGGANGQGKATGDAGLLPGDVVRLPSMAAAASATTAAAAAPAVALYAAEAFKNCGNSGPAVTASPQPRPRLLPAGQEAAPRTGRAVSNSSLTSLWWRSLLPGLHVLGRTSRAPISEHPSHARMLDVRTAGRTPLLVSRDRSMLAPLPYSASEVLLPGLDTGALNGGGYRTPSVHSGSSSGVSGFAKAAAALCSSLLGPLRSLILSAAQVLGAPGGGTSLTAHCSGAGSVGATGLRTSGGLVMQMVSDFLPRVAGSLVPRTGSSTSLSMLVDAYGSHQGAGMGSPAQQGNWGPGPGGAHMLLLSGAETNRKPAFSDLQQNAGRVQVLSVDDEPVNQQVMRALLWAAEYEVLEARSGEEALELVRNCKVLPDLVLLDVTLGGDISGFEVCREIRREYSPGELPVIMITCSSLEEDVIRGLAVGANDYMIKPLRNLELMARIKTQLALKRSIRVASEARVNMSLLGSILPANVIKQLKEGVTLIAQFHQEVTILFSDIRGFTNLATEWPTEQIILMLNNMFTAFDRLCDDEGVYKVETIGDAYMIVSGHDGVSDHAPRMLRMATRMLEAVSDMRGYDGRELQIRVGIHTGPAHSGVVGLSRPRYCFFGDTVNTASRMESTGFSMAIQVSESTMRAVTSQPELAAEFRFAPCGPRDIKGKGTMHTYLLCVGLFEQALAELAAPAAYHKRRAGSLAAPPQPARAAAAGPERPDVATTAPPPVPAAAAAAAASLTSSAAAMAAGAGSAYSGAVGTGASSSIMMSPFQSLRSATVQGFDYVVLPTGPLPQQQQDSMCDGAAKYTSWRYHHAQSGHNAMSSGGTNVLMENGLAFIGPSLHVVEGVAVEHSDHMPSAVVGGGLASTADNGGGVMTAAAATGGAGAPLAPDREASTDMFLEPTLSPQSMSVRPDPPKAVVSTTMLPLSSSSVTTTTATAAMITMWPPASARSSVDLFGAGSSASPSVLGTTLGMTINTCSIPAPPGVVAQDSGPSPAEGRFGTAPSAASCVGTDGGALRPGAVPKRGQGAWAAAATSMPILLQRSRARTSEELSLAARGSNCSTDEEAEASAAAASAIPTQGSVDGAPTGLDGEALADEMLGWSLLIRALDHTERDAPRGVPVDMAAASNSLGARLKNRIVDPAAVRQLALAVRVAAPLAPPSPSPALPWCDNAAVDVYDGANAPGGGNSNKQHSSGYVISLAGSVSQPSAFVAEPIVPVAADALAAAVDSVLYGDVECAAARALARSPTVTTSPPLPTPDGGVVAFELGAETFVATPSSSGSSGRLLPSEATSRPGTGTWAAAGAIGAAAHAVGASASHLCRTGSHGGVAQSLRLSHERPTGASCAPAANGTASSGRASPATVDGGSLFGDSGVGAATAIASAGSTGTAARGSCTAYAADVAPARGNSVGGLPSPRDIGNREHWTRPHMGRRPATANGTMTHGGGGSGGGATNAAVAAQILTQNSAGANIIAPYGHGINLYGGSLGNIGSHAAFSGWGRGSLYNNAGAVGTAVQQPLGTTPGLRSPSWAHYHHYQNHPYAPLGSGSSTAPGFRGVVSHYAGGASPGSAARLGQDESGLGARSRGIVQARTEEEQPGANRAAGGGGVPWTTAQPASGAFVQAVGATAGPANSTSQLASAGSMGRVSIISQGWSNLYDPLVPRPRLTNHYCASLDLDELQSGIRTPGSIPSPSLGSGYVSPRPSPPSLTPMPSGNRRCMDVAAGSGAALSVPSAQASLRDAPGQQQSRHPAAASVWEEALAAGPYGSSSLGRTAGTPGGEVSYPIGADDPFVVPNEVDDSCGGGGDAAAAAAVSPGQQQHQVGNQQQMEGHATHVQHPHSQQQQQPQKQGHQARPGQQQELQRDISSHLHPQQPLLPPTKVCGKDNHALLFGNVAAASIVRSRSGEVLDDASGGASIRGGGPRLWRSQSLDVSRPRLGAVVPGHNVDAVAATPSSSLYGSALSAQTQAPGSSAAKALAGVQEWRHPPAGGGLALGSQVAAVTAAQRRNVDVCVRQAQLAGSPAVWPAGNAGALSGLFAAPNSSGGYGPQGEMAGVAGFTKSSMERPAASTTATATMVAIPAADARATSGGRSHTAMSPINSAAAADPAVTSPQMRWPWGGVGPLAQGDSVMAEPTRNGTVATDDDADFGRRDSFSSTGGYIAHRTSYGRNSYIIPYSRDSVDLPAGGVFPRSSVDAGAASPAAAVAARSPRYCAPPPPPTSLHPDAADAPIVLYGRAAVGGAIGGAAGELRRSLESPQIAGPGSLGVPAVVLTYAAEGPSAAAAGAPGGGLDIARMLARASEVVVAVPAVGGGGGGLQAGRLQQPSPLTPPHPGHQEGGGPVGAGLAAIAEAAQPCLIPEAVPLPAAPQDALAPSGLSYTGPVGSGGAGAAGFHYPPPPHIHPHTHSHPHHPLHHHHRHHHPYGIGQSIAPQRLDPVEEGCGSSSVVTADADSSSIVDGVTREEPLLGGGGGGGGGGGEGGGRVAAAACAALVPPGDAAPAANDRMSYTAHAASGSEHRGDGQATHAAASSGGGAAAAGVARGNSGRGHFLGSGGARSDAAEAGRQPSRAKRSFAVLVRKVKRALYVGGGGEPKQYVVG